MWRWDNSFSGQSLFPARKFWIPLTQAWKIFCRVSMKGNSSGFNNVMRPGKIGGDATYEIENINSDA